MRSPSVSEPNAYFDAEYSVSQGSVTFPAIELTFTMHPPACRRICGTTLWIIPSAPKKFSSYIRLTVSNGACQAGAYNPAPALLIRMSTRPWRSSVASTAMRRSSSAVTSPAITSPLPAATRSRLALLRAISASKAPRSRNRAAHAAPIPSDAPVIRTTFP
ncbi:MAG: hypothetical protein IANPNBLG_00523 [Bryobacteraceae bacterium]|nr:hypothetical protein [Bryobacteraceae bacterium]